MAKGQQFKESKGKKPKDKSGKDDKAKDFVSRGVKSK